jgi:hypothetical protein
MLTIDLLAEAALGRDALQVRALARDLMRMHPQLRDVPPPQSLDPRVQTVAAGLIELLAENDSQKAPSWSTDIGGLKEPFHLLEAAARMPRLRAQCEAESPAPLRKRNLFAPSGFLTFA